MAKKKTSVGLTGLERFGGTVFFVFYLLLLPLAAGPVRRLAGELLGRPISEELYGAAYYYGLFAVTALLFHHLLGVSTRRFLDGPARTLKTAAAGIVAYYGLCELAARLGKVLADRSGNLNDAAISARTGSAPHMTLLIVVFLAPFVEETLFRGLVFGGLREKSRPLLPLGLGEDGISFVNDLPVEAVAKAGHIKVQPHKIRVPNVLRRPRDRRVSLYHSVFPVGILAGVLIRPVR